MKPSRRICMLTLLFALAAGCGRGGGGTTGTTNGPPATTVGTPATAARPTTTAAPSGRTTTSSPVQGVTDGAVCSPSGATGLTSAKLPMVCMPIAGGNELRWRPA
jgi:hypothetical protein